MPTLQLTGARKQRALRLILLVGGLFLSTGALAGAVEDCGRVQNAERIIRACTAVIQGRLSKTAGIAIAYHNRGYAYASRGELDQAISNYDQAIQLGPGVARFYLNRSLSLQAKGEIDRAIADLNAAILLEPKAAELYYWRGTMHDARQEHDGAFTNYSKAIDLNPKLKLAYNNRGLIHVNRGEIQRGVQDYDRAIELDPREAVFYNNRGHAHLVGGRRDLALQDLNMAINLNGKLANSYYHRGTLHEDQGAFEQADADFNVAVQLNPNYAAATARLCRAKIRAKSWGKAVEACTSAIALNPETFNSYSNRGVAHIQLRRDNEGLADFKKAVELDPHAPQPRSALCYLSLQKWDYEAAIAQCAKVMELDPKDSNARRWLVNAFDERARGKAENGRRQEAIADLDRSIELDPTAMRHLWRARLRTANGDFAQALADYTKAMELDPKRDEARLQRAYVLQKTGKLAEAMADVQSILKERPFDLNALETRGEIYEAMGKRTEAMRDLRDVSRRSPNRPSTKEALARLALLPPRPEDCEQNDDRDLQLRACTAVIDRGGDVFWALLRRGENRMVRHSYDGAVADFTKLIEAQPTVQTYEYRAQALQAKDEIDQALEDYSRAIEQSAGASGRLLQKLHAARAECYERKGAYKKAIDDYTRAIELYPDYVIYFLSRARALVKAGRYMEALLDAERAMEDVAYRWDALEVRARTYEARGEVQLAIADYREVVLRDPSREKSRKALERLEVDITRELQDQADIGFYTMLIQANPKGRMPIRTAQACT